MNRIHHHRRLLAWAVLTACQFSIGCQHLHCFKKAPPEEPTAPVHVSGHVRTPGPVSVEDGPLTLSESINRAGGAESPLAVPAPRERFGKVVRALDALIRELEAVEDFARDYPADPDIRALFAFKEKISEKRAEAGLVIGDLAIDEPLKKPLLKLIESDYTATVKALDDLALARPADEASASQAVEQIREFIDALTSRRTELQQTDQLQSSLLVPGTTTAPMLVCLKRDGQRRFYEFGIATRGEAAGLPLLPGDSVTVLRYDETALANPRPQNGGGIVLTGWTEAQGAIAIDALQRISQVQKSTSLRVDVPDSRLRIQIIRRSIGDDQPVMFILPYEARLQQPLRTFELHPGDRVSIIPDIQVPLVMEQMVGTIVASGLATQLELIHQKKPMVSPMDRASLWLREHKSRTEAAVRETLSGPRQQ